MPSIKSIEVRLHVADIARSVAFYCNTLGFKIDMLWPEHSPEFAILNDHSLKLQLTKHASTSTQAPACTLWLDVAGVSDFHSNIKDKVGVEWGPEVYSYGRREFAFKDPDGHLVILSEATNDPPSCNEE
jgi:catechol 2,3-dioxygenase-like lactoylglutathione lyase family enzyme